MSQGTDFQFPKLILKSGRERSIVNRHPWIFSGAVKTLPQAQTGDIVSVYNNHMEWLAYGFYDQKSEIVCKLFEFNSAVNPNDETYWENRLKDAMSLRTRLLDLSQTNTFRLVHAEGDSIPGLIVDIYDTVAVFQVLHRGIQNHLDAITKAIYQLGIQYIYFKTKTSSKQIENIDLPKGWHLKSCSMPFVVLENSMKIEVNVETGQKTGFFIDQRDNRLLLKTYSKGKKVLNAFSYTGGFSIAAFKGGASEVFSVDISKEAIEACDRNIKLNNASTEEKHIGLVQDCFDYLRTMEPNLYDIIVLDPPAFAKHARAVTQASRGYKEINLKAIQAIKKGGLLFTFSCSKNIDTELFRKIVFGAAADAGRQVQIVHQLTQGSDHPINIYHPEGEYLKGLVLYIQ